MKIRLRRGFAAVAVIALAFTLLALSMAAPVISTSEDFSIFNSGWNGTSDLAVATYTSGKFAPSFQVSSTGTELTIEQVGLERLGLVATTDSLVIIGPSKTFTAEEGAVVGDFVRSGGMLLLADDFGTANSLLAGMNASSRFSGDLVMDLAFEKQPEFSVGFDFEEDPLTANVTTLLLNYPSSVTVVPGTADVLARSSVASWRDTNGDRMQEWGEPRGPFPLLVRERLGQGTIVLLSDPSTLINGMRKNLNNSVFASNLMDYVCRDRTSVYFDESHRDFFDPVAIAFEVTGQISTNWKIALVVLVFVATLWMSSDLVDRLVSWTWRMIREGVFWVLGFLSPLFARKAAPPKAIPDTETLVGMVTAKHKDWKPGLVRYIVRAGGRHLEALERAKNESTNPLAKLEEASQETEPSS